MPLSPRQMEQMAREMADLHRLDEMDPAARAGLVKTYRAEVKRLAGEVHQQIEAAREVRTLRTMRAISRPMRERRHAEIALERLERAITELAQEQEKTN